MWTASPVIMAASIYVYRRIDAEPVPNGLLITHQPCTHWLPAALRPQPLTAPAATPLMMCFWQKMYTRIMGMMLSMMTAMVAPRSTEP